MDKRTYITAAGLAEEALAKEQGRKVQIAKVVVGRGQLSAELSPIDQTELLDPIDETLAFTFSRRDKPGQFYVDGELPRPATGYQYFEIGTVTDTGVLYTYTRAIGDYVPSDSEADEVDKLSRIRLNFNTQNVDVVEVTIDSSALYVITPDFQAHLDEYHAFVAEAHRDFERKDNAATDADIDNESTAEKHVKLPQFWRAVSPSVLVNKLWLALSARVCPVGVPLPWPTDIAPDGFAIMKGQAFDMDANPETAKAYPLGILDDMRGLAIVGKKDGEVVLAYEADEVKEHGHSGSTVSSTNLGSKGSNNSHAYYLSAVQTAQVDGNRGSMGIPSSGWSGYQVKAGASGGAWSTRYHNQPVNHSHSVSIGSHAHSVAIALFGAVENTIKNRKYNWIVRLA